MRAVIIEDEHIAAKALATLINEIIPEAEIVAVLQSIDESVEWFEEDGKVDIVFMDIHLADGSSFSIFDKVSISAPIIFTTAYDKYALKAFEVNSIDYLLKPISKPDLERAINKLRSFGKDSKESQELNAAMIEKVVESMRLKGSQYKSTLLVAFRDKLIPLRVSEIAFIHIAEGVVQAYTHSSETHTLEQTMEELSKSLNPDDFIRANRQFIVAKSAVKDMSSWFGGRLSVNLTLPTPERIYVSKARSNEFKEWMMN